MSEKVLGAIRVNRPGFARTTSEALFLTQYRVIVARTSSGWADIFGVVGVGIDLVMDKKRMKKLMEKEDVHELSPENILKADEHNYAIPNSEITKVELKKAGIRGSVIQLYIITSKKKFKWYYKGIKVEDYENILRPIFRDKLSVKKSYSPFL